MKDIIPRLEVTFPFSRKFCFWFGKQKYMPEKNIFLFNHARSGMITALKSLGLGTGAKIGMMCYNCKSVMNAIDNCGFEIVFIDINENLTIDICDLMNKAAGLSALVVTHLFGIPNDIEEIKKVVPNSVIIEDCAHAFGSDMCGKEGDFAVFSVGFGKFPCIGDGGILKINNPKYLSLVNDLYSEIPNYSLKDNISLFIKLTTKAFLYKKRIYNYFTLPLFKSKSHTTEIKEYIKLRRMSPGIRRILSYGMEEKSYLSVRRKQAEQVCMFVNTIDKVKVIGTTNGFMQPVICNTPATLKQLLTDKGVETETHFKKCIEWARQFGYDNSCPCAEAIISKLLVIPTYKINETFMT